MRPLDVADEHAQIRSTPLRGRDLQTHLPDHTGAVLVNAKYLSPPKWPNFHYLLPVAW